MPGEKKIATFCYNVVNNQAVKFDRSARTIKVTSEQLSSYVEFISANFFISISKTPTKRTKKLIEFNGFTPNPNARENPMRCIDEMNAQPSKTNYGLCIIWISECEMRCGSVSLMNCWINGQVTCKHNDGADFCYRYVIIGMDLWNFFLICQFLYVSYREVTRSNNFWHLNWAIIHWNSPKCQNNVTLNFIFRWEMSTIPTKISGIFRHMWHADTFPFPTQRRTKCGVCNSVGIFSIFMAHFDYVEWMFNRNQPNLLSHCCHWLRLVILIIMQIIHAVLKRGDGSKRYIFWIANDMLYDYYRCCLWQCMCSLGY